MPTIVKPLNVTILDWGSPSKPMVIKCDDTPLILDLPSPLKGHDKRCAEYPTYQLEAPANLRPGPKSVHLGFYGYLRVTNAMCLQKSGVSIFDLGDALWRMRMTNSAIRTRRSMKCSPRRGSPPARSSGHADANNAP